MKIAFIGQKGIPVISGGVERRVQELSTRMVKLGHEVFVYARKNYNSEELTSYSGVNIIYLPFIDTKHLGTITHTLIASFHAVFKKYDVVHFQAPGPSSLCWIIKFFSPKTILVATFNSRDEKHQKWGKIARAYLRFGEYMINKIPDKTIVISEILKEFSKEKFGNNNTVVIYNGSSVTQTEKEDEIKKFGLEKNKYFLSVSRLIKHKGVHYLIEAFKENQKKGKIPLDFKLVIAGDSCYTDSYVNHLKKISEENKNIIFVGNQWGEALSQLFTYAFIFVQPSEAEGLSNALLEAMGYGIPSIVSDIPENKTVINENGLIFKNKNITDLADKMAYAISNSENIKKLGQMAKQSVEKKYSWDENTTKTLELYEELRLKKNQSFFGFFCKRSS